MVVQILDAEPDSLAWTRTSNRQRVGQQPELIIDPVGSSDELPHRGVGENDVAGLLRIRQTGQSDFPGVAVLIRLSCCAACSSAALTQAIRRLIVDGAIVPSRLSRHCFNSVAQQRQGL